LNLCSLEVEANLRLDATIVGATTTAAAEEAARRDRLSELRRTQVADDDAGVRVVE